MIHGRLSKWELSIRKRAGRLLRRLGTKEHSNLEFDSLAAYFEGKSVALVGNARSLSNSEFGTDIDNHSVVIRLNTAPMTSSLSHGTRTDVVATSVILTKARFDELKAGMIWWMTPKPMALPGWMTRLSRYYRYPEVDHAALMSKLGARPTTGLMVIEMLHSLPCQSVDMFGFDFFSSFSLSNERAMAPSAHDFSKERNYVYALTERDLRFRLICS
jgi:hypothetical protein